MVISWIADGVLEMDDVVARLGRERIDAAADVATRAPDAPLAPEDLVVGENAQSALAIRRWQQEAAAERTDDERRRRRLAGIFVEQLVEALRLPLVVAEDDR